MALSWDVAHMHAPPAPSFPRPGARQFFPSPLPGRLLRPKRLHAAWVEPGPNSAAAPWGFWAQPATPCPAAELPPALNSPELPAQLLEEKADGEQAEGGWRGEGAGPVVLQVPSEAAAEGLRGQRHSDGQPQPLHAAAGPDARQSLP